MTRPMVFISYSHADEAWKDRLVKHLKVLEQEDCLDLWDDQRIGAGGDWYREIQEAIKAARVAILLVSADFLISKFIRSEEVPPLLERREKDGLRIFPVLIKPCNWKQVKWLASFQLRPKDGRDISGGNEYQIETDMVAIAEEVAAIIVSPQVVSESTQKIFISYSHNDEKWKDLLVKNLKALQYGDILYLWDDSRIEAGKDWYQEIQGAINSASVAILLISADFLASDFIRSEDVHRLIERRKNEGVNIFPIIIKPCPWKAIRWLSQMQVRPKDGRAISTGNENQIDEDLTTIAVEVATVIEHNSGTQ